MIDQERTFISFMEDKHPILQEMPIEFRSLWFQKFQSVQTKEFLFLQMERIFGNTKDQFVDLLTFEIADVDVLTEWEEEFPTKSFIASDPSIIFFDGIDDQGRGLFSVGDLDRQTMDFTPQLEVFISCIDEGIAIDFGDDTIEVWTKV